ncbi:MAG: DUF898 domain-containing protein [Magnetospirillum sp.]|nr:DUF898 domain-containing protein [Magnetospirillum sp.]
MFPSGTGAGTLPRTVFGGKALSEPQSPRPFTQSGGTLAMIRVALVNLGLSMVTLSLWRFWGRTRVRRLLWGGVSAWGDPVEYTGTGKELFMGFLMVLVVIYLPLALGFGWAQTLTAAGDPRGPLVISLLYFVTILLVAAGLYRARRYQMSRTRWRGIRGGQTGSALGYAARSLLVWLLLPLSLGWAWPWGEMMLARYRFNHTTFGDHPLSCDAHAGGLYGRFALVWLSGLGFLLIAGFAVWVAADAASIGQMDETVATGLVVVILLMVSVIVLALPWAWYRAGFYRRLAGGLSFQGARFAADFRTARLIRLVVGNMLISLFSLGILRPWAALRTFRYACSAIQVEGVPDFDAIHQNTETGPKAGEGLISVLDGAGEF